MKLLQDYLSLKSLAQFLGKGNFIYQGRIDGFREGDEAGDKSMITHTFGKLPSFFHQSPTQSIQQNWGILEGELVINWLSERLL